MGREREQGKDGEGAGELGIVAGLKNLVPRNPSAL